MKIVNLAISEEHLEVILRGLAEMPYRLSAPTIAELHKQVTGQNLQPDQTKQNGAEMRHD